MPKAKFDQIIFIRRLVLGTICNVEIKNRDGSMAGNCLNGLRALTHFLATQGKMRDQVAFYQGRQFLASGVKRKGGGIIEVCVDFPEFLKGREGQPDHVKLGNEHLVYWTLRRSAEKPASYIPKLNEEYIYFYEETRIGDDRVGHLYANVYEAGVGRTGSCGSGAVAAAFSANQKYGGCFWAVHFPGGALSVRVDTLDNRVILGGPTERIS